IEVEEIGETFAANADLKASGYASQTSLWTLADDSGLEIEALGGVPGVFSARYAGENATSQQRNDKVLFELREAKDANRRARFICVISFAVLNGIIIHFEKVVCEGRIALRSRGTNGFGYDSIFIPDGYEYT